jgi:hypothetical protein
LKPRALARGVFIFIYKENTLNLVGNKFLYLILSVIAGSAIVTIFVLGGTQTHRLFLGRHVLLNTLVFFREVFQAFLMPRKEFIQHNILPELIVRLLPLFIFLIFNFLIIKQIWKYFFKFWQRNKENVLFLFAWIFITLMPAIFRPVVGGFLPVRYLYIPLMGVYFLLALYFESLLVCIASNVIKGNSIDKFGNRFSLNKKGEVELSRLIIKKFLVMKFVFQAAVFLIILYSVALNLKTLIFMSDKFHREARWVDPSGQKEMVLSVIPQLKRIYPRLPDSSTLFLENMPVHGMVLKAIIEFYYQNGLKVVEVEKGVINKGKRLENLFYFKVID